MLLVNLSSAFNTIIPQQQPVLQRGGEAEEMIIESLHSSLKTALHQVSGGEIADILDVSLPAPDEESTSISSHPSQPRHDESVPTAVSASGLAAPTLTKPCKDDH